MGVSEISDSGGELVTVNAGDCHEEHDTVVSLPLIMILTGFVYLLFTQNKCSTMSISIILHHFTCRVLASPTTNYLHHLVKNVTGCNNGN